MAMQKRTRTARQTRLRSRMDALRVLFTPHLCLMGSFGFGAVNSELYGYAP
jgi:hypothetical protein